MKKYLWIILAILLWASPARTQFYPVSAPDATFACSLAAIAATLTQCQAIPAVATQSYYITGIIVQTTTATPGSYAIQSGTGANCVAATTVVFPRSGTGSDRFLAPIAANPPAVIPFQTPLKVTAGHEICFIGVGTDTTNVHIYGYVK